MRKIKVLLTTICFLLVFTVLCIKANSVSAAGTIDTSSLEANQIVGGDGVTSTYTSDGILAQVPGADTVGSSEAWRYSAKVLAEDAIGTAGSIANDSSVSMEFSVEYYDDQGNTVSRSQCGNLQGSYALDIYVHNSANDAQLAMLRIWVDAGGWNLGNHSAEVIGSNWDTVVYSTPWINGNATLKSSFFIQFDKNELFKSYVNNGNDIARLDNNSNQALSIVDTSGVDNIYFRICGENGFTNTTRILVRSINGQKLVKQTSDGSESEIPFVSPGGSTTAGLVSEGIKVNATSVDSVSNFGVYDLKYGVDVKFIASLENNVNNSYIDFVLTNADNFNYSLKYRIWINSTNSELSPTNIYIKTNGNEIGYENAGWINRKVDGVDEQYHMKFDIVDTLLADVDGDLVQNLCAVEQIKAFMNSCPSTKFYVGFTNGGFSSSTSEYIVTEINGQSLSNVGGIYDKVNDAQLYVENLPVAVTQNNTATINTYSKDVFADTVNTVVITSPSNQVSQYETTGSVNHKFTELGEHTVEVSTTGSNGVRVSKTYKVSVKTKVQTLTFTVPSYSLDIGEIGDQITILAATNYSSNVVTKKIVLVMPWTNEERVVNVGDQITFDGPGVYTVRYIAQDDALPTPNEKVEEVYINIIDKQKPVVNVTLPKTAETGDEITFDVKVTDQSDYDVAIYVTFPDGTRCRYALTDKFVPTKSGEYQIKVVVEDMYWNKEEVLLEMNVSGEDIEDSEEDSEADDLFGDMFGDDDPLGNLDNTDTDTDSGNGVLNVLLTIGIIILIFLPGVLVYIIKSRKL